MTKRPNIDVSDCLRTFKRNKKSLLETFGMTGSEIIDVLFQEITDDRINLLTGELLGIVGLLLQEDFSKNQLKKALTILSDNKVSEKIREQTYSLVLYTPIKLDGKDAIDVSGGFIRTAIRMLLNEETRDFATSALFAFYNGVEANWQDYYSSKLAERVMQISEYRVENPTALQEIILEVACACKSKVFLDNLKDIKINYH